MKNPLLILIALIIVAYIAVMVLENTGSRGVYEIYLNDGTRCVVNGSPGGIDCDWEGGKDGY